MKMLSKYLFSVLFSLICTHSFAQTTDSRPALYAAYPSSISINKTSLDNLLTNETGKVVSMPLSAGFTFEGTVISNVTKYNSMHTVMVRSVEHAESIFQITKTENKENVISYSGRIFNKNAADGYEIKNNNGEYSLQKFETAKILDPCKL
jgi:hypothetical protein